MIPSIYCTHFKIKFNSTFTTVIYIFSYYIILQEATMKSYFAEEVEISGKLIYACIN
jgi:hypothetical protein